MVFVALVTKVIARTPVRQPLMAEPQARADVDTGSDEAPRPGFSRDAFEAMRPTDLARLLWSELRAPGREAERLEAERALSNALGEPHQPGTGTPAAWEREAMAKNDRQEVEAALARLVELAAKAAPGTPLAKALDPIVVGYRAALTHYPGSREFAEGHVRRMSTDALRAQIALYDQTPADRRLAAQAPYVEVWRETLRKRESGELADPGPRYTHHPQAIGTREDPLLAFEDTGWSADGTRKATYASFAQVPVFRGAARPGDAVQGALSDCWMISAFSSLAVSHADLIAAAVESTDGGEAVVRLFDEQGGERRTPIDFDLPVHDAEKALPLYARPAGDAPVLWPALLEKGFAAQGPRGYQALTLEGIGNGHDQTPEAVLSTLTGKPVKAETVAGEGDFERFVEAFVNGAPATCVLLPPPGPTAHCFAVLAVDAITRQVTVRDPLAVDSRQMAGRPGVTPTGEPGVFRVSADALFRDFTDVAVYRLG